MKKEKGSFFVTLIIIAIFVGAGVFYIKTSHPGFYNKAVDCLKSGSLETLTTNVYDSVISDESDGERDNNGLTL